MRIFLLLIVTSALFAAEEEHSDGGSHEEAHAKNHLGIFLGSTKEEGRFSDTYGFRYSRRINNLMMSPL